MASEKKPSVYDDRGTIGSSDELDEYGVWVKSEAQDLSFADTGSLEKDDSLDADIDIPDLEEFPGLEALAMDDNPDDDSSDFFNLGTDDESEDSSFDLGNFGEEAEEIPIESDDSVDLEGSLESDDSFSNDLFESDDSIELEDSFESDVSFESDDSVDLEGSLESEDSIESDDSFDAEDNSLELIDLLDLSDDSDYEEENPALEESGDDEDEDDDEGEYIEIAMDDFIGPLAEEAAEEKSSSADLSTQLLMKIAEELSSIRSELASIKEEFSGLKAAHPQGEQREGGFFGEEDDEKISLTGDELTHILNTADFTQDEAVTIIDEEIALTGEELSHIIDTADFTEEVGADAANGLSAEDFNMMDDVGTEIPSFEEPGEESLDLISDDLLSDSFESTDFEIDDEIPSDFPVEEVDEFIEFFDHQAESESFIPTAEEADYLANDPLAGGVLAEAEEPLDLSRIVVDEPDLSTSLEDDSPEEQSLEDISIVMDLAEMESGDVQDNTEIELSGPEETEVEELELAMDLPEDISDLEGEEEIEELVEIEELEEIEEPEEEFPEDEVPVSLDDESAEEGGDESLIPEGYSEEGQDLTPDTISLDLSLPGEEEEDFIPEEDMELLLIEDEDTFEEIEEAGEDEGLTIAQDTSEDSGRIPSDLKHELKTVLSYMDQLLESLPDEKVEEFARSEYYDTYKKLFKELGLV